ncbi:SRPBCC family protein [Kribbella antibiotica]|uniref:SRPBCC family protein n=1 Tax=Kribbella antibiotica TaxID=190195 RepID=A0A4V6PDW2_9ACTN|nr:SRPBCC family protein [Kribbella antibiotica]TDD48207.1 SRPBCC family protein [Kribbella antibiotica]
MPDLTAKITVAAPADTLYALVSDLPRMGEWSPECTGVTWNSRTPGPATGARFIGRNRSGVARWPTQGRVLEAEPGRRFTFEIFFGPLQVALWSYDFTVTDGGCEVTESWTDRRPAALKFTMNTIVGDRVKINEYGIRTTLERLKAAAEN